LRREGYDVLATDLVDYQSPDQDHAGWDFLMERSCHEREAIITNPPFKNASVFVSHALDLTPKVFMLLRLAFLESGSTKSEAGRARIRCMDEQPPSRVHVFRNRLPRMHREGWDGPKSTSAMSFAWFVWDQEHVGPTTLHRLSWEGSVFEEPVPVTMPDIPESLRR
jgi:hypothetical protein